MKHRIKATLALLLCSVLCSCTEIPDELPDNYSTDTITESTVSQLLSETALTYDTSVSSSAETAVSEISQVTILSESVSETETVPSESELQSDSDTVTVSDTYMEISEIESETSLSEALESETTSETIFEPGTLPPETTAVITSETKPTAPSVTIVTIPTLPVQETDTFSETSVTSDTSADTQSDTYYPQSSYYPLNFDRQKAMWVSYLEYDRMMRNADEAQFTEALGKCFDNIAALGCNTVYFQVRVYGDAYYSSSLFPKGDRLTGDYDPLRIAVRAAHDRGLSLHAWINPMRLMTDSQMKSYSTEYKIGEWYNDPSKNGKYIVNSAGRWYLNPAHAETVSLICDGISEIVTAYDVDGIQIDDYFYPTTDTSFDSAAYEASGTDKNLADWRRETVTKMVKRMYETVHSANPRVLFGISPQGNTDNNYNDLYADVFTWVSTEGCCDYICPQIYFGFENGALPYAETVDKWDKLVTSDNVKLVIGLAAYKSGTEDKYAGAGSSEWIDSTDILARQRDLTDIYNAGYAYFRYDSLFLPEPSVAASVNAELENLRK